MTPRLTDAQITDYFARLAARRGTAPLDEFRRMVARARAGDPLERPGASAVHSTRGLIVVDGGRGRR